MVFLTGTVKCLRRGREGGRTWVFFCANVWQIEDAVANRTHGSVLSRATHQPQNHRGWLRTDLRHGIPGGAFPNAPLLEPPRHTSVRAMENGNSTWLLAAPQTKATQNVPNQNCKKKKKQRAVASLEKKIRVRKKLSNKKTKRWTCWGSNLSRASDSTDYSTSRLQSPSDGSF